MEQLENNLHKT